MERMGFRACDHERERRMGRAPARSADGQRHRLPLGNQALLRLIGGMTASRARPEVQLLADGRRDPASADEGVRHRVAERGTRDPAAPLPHLDVIQRCFGRHDVSGVRAHSGALARSATASLGASAYATGDHVVFNGAPDLFTAAHEAAHVVQQRGGVQLKGGFGSAGDAYERSADEVAQAAVQGRSAERLLDRHAPTGRRDAGGGAPSVQCLSYRHLRSLHSHYRDETRQQNPDQLGSIRLKVEELKEMERRFLDASSSPPKDRYFAENPYVPESPYMTEYPYVAESPYMAENPYAAPPDVESASDLWERVRTLGEFLRLQDVDVTLEVPFDESSLDSRFVEHAKSKEEQDRSLVDIDGGRLYRNDEEHTPVDTKDSSTWHAGTDSEIFVMGQEGDIHMSSHKIGKYHHSSLLAGQPVAAAGTMTVHDGKIEYLDSKSGHYRPTQIHMDQFLHRLLTQRVSMDFRLVVRSNFYVELFNGTASDYLGGDETAEHLEFFMMQQRLDDLVDDVGGRELMDALAKQGLVLAQSSGDDYVVYTKDRRHVTLDELEAALAIILGPDEYLTSPG